MRNTFVRIFVIAQLLAGCSIYPQEIYDSAGTNELLVIATACVASLIFLLIVIFVNKKLQIQQIKTSQEMRLRTEQERISKVLHDDIGSGLTSISLLAETMIAKDGHDHKKEHIHRISKISAELIDQMSETVWLFNHLDDTINQLLAHLRTYMAEHLQKTKYDLKLNFKNNIHQDFEINGLQRSTILFIVREVFHNAIIHSEASVFLMECTATEGSIIIMLKDNGVGLPENIDRNTNGLNKIKKSLTDMQGKITFEKKFGTLITVEIPKKMIT